MFFGSQVCLAGTMGEVTPTASYDGLYLGADIGVSDFMVRDFTYIPPDIHTLGSLGIVGGGLVGYDYTIYNHVKLGLEGFINATGLNAAT